MRYLYPLVFCFVAAACGDDGKPVTPATDTTTTDSASDVAISDVVDVMDDVALDSVGDATVPLDVVMDVIDPDVGPDAAETVADTGPDTSEPVVPLAGFGAISGTCGFIDDELFDTAPSFVVNAIDFAADPYDTEDFDLLTENGRELIRDGNAGGNSLYSEVFAMEVLTRCELATLIASETEIVYAMQGKITDILVEIDGEYVGVSVVRAVGFPKDAPYTVEQATTIMERKLFDIQVSSRNVSEQHKWVKQILHVLAYADQHATSIQAAWEALPSETKADTIVIVTVTNGADAFMY